MLFGTVWNERRKPEGSAAFGADSGGSSSIYARAESMAALSASRGSFGPQHHAKGNSTRGKRMFRRNSGAALRPLREAALVAGDDEGRIVGDQCRGLSAALLSSLAAYL